MGNPRPVDSFLAASGIDAAALGQLIAGLAVVACVVWGAIYLRRVFWFGWQRGDLAHIVVGGLLALVLLFFVTWAVTHY